MKSDLPRHAVAVPGTKRFGQEPITDLVWKHKVEKKFFSAAFSDSTCLIVNPAKQKEI